jgi:F-type H+-transporting ATPase subunit gamma
MAGTKEIKSRIKSVRSTKKVTKAMELVSASKMKRAVVATTASRPYTQYALDILHSLSVHDSEYVHPLMVVRPVEKVLVILITSNRSLCGGYNAQALRATNELLNSYHGVETDFISVGSKGETALRRMGQKIIASFNDFPAAPIATEAFSVIDLAMKYYKEGEYDRVLVVYTHFVSALAQEARVETLLPIQRHDDEEEERKADTTEYVFEPSYEILMDTALEKITRQRMFQYILESFASEHSARMMAMKNATDAATDMVDELTLAFNKARQAGITQEISELSAGMASVN